jgi:HicB-like protein involved in pilus formation
MSVKRVTIRVSPNLHRQVAQTAAEHALSLNEFIVKALEAYLQQLDAPKSPWPLPDLSALLTPAAETQGITEDDVLTHLRETRRRIWEERYRQTVQQLHAKSS